MIRSLILSLLLVAPATAGELIYFPRQAVNPVVVPDKPAVPAERFPRVLVLSTCPECAVHEIADEVDALKAKGWKVGGDQSSHIQLVNLTKTPEYAKFLGGDQLPEWLCINREGVIRRFAPDAGTPLDRWTIGWLGNGQDERPSPPVRAATTVQQYSERAVRRSTYCPTCPR